jgi:hypothetical protein
MYNNTGAPPEKGLVAGARPAFRLDTAGVGAKRRFERNSGAYNTADNSETQTYFAFYAKYMGASTFFMLFGIFSIATFATAKGRCCNGLQQQAEMLTTN